MKGGPVGVPMRPERGGKRVLCANPWTARYIAAIFYVGARGVVHRFTFVHDRDQSVPFRERPTPHRLFG